jgi:hypothetical protein
MIQFLNLSTSQLSTSQPPPPADDIICLANRTGFSFKKNIAICYVIAKRKEKTAQGDFSMDELCILIF